MIPLSRVDFNVWLLSKIHFHRIVLFSWSNWICLITLMAQHFNLYSTLDAIANDIFCRDAFFFNFIILLLFVIGIFAVVLLRACTYIFQRDYSRVFVCRTENLSWVGDGSSWAGIAWLERGEFHQEFFQGFEVVRLEVIRSEVVQLKVIRQTQTDPIFKYRTRSIGSPPCTLRHKLHPPRHLYGWFKSNACIIPAIWREQISTNDPRVC